MDFSASGNVSSTNPFIFSKTVNATGNLNEFGHSGTIASETMSVNQTAITKGSIASLQFAGACSATLLNPPKTGVPDMSGSGGFTMYQSNGLGNVRYIVSTSSSPTSSQPNVRLGINGVYTTLPKGTSKGIIKGPINCGLDYGVPGTNNWFNDRSYVKQDMSLNISAQFQQLPSLRYFGVGINWSNVADNNLNKVRGDLDANNLQTHLGSDLPTFKQGMVVQLDATKSTAQNLNDILTQFTLFKQSVNAGDTIILYISTHGSITNDQVGGLSYIQLAIASDGADGLTSGVINTLLSSLSDSIRKIVIIDACHSGGIAAALVSSNTSVLAASSAVGSTGCRPDGTGIFTDALIAELDHGVCDLGQITNDIANDVLGTNASLLGSSLSLKDLGTAIFSGLQPQFYQTPNFSGDILGPAISVLQQLPTSSATVTNGSLQFKLSQVPTEGYVAIESSSDLISWQQVGFSPSTGNDLLFSFPMSSARNFYRARIIP